MGPHNGSLNVDRLLDPPHAFEENTGKEGLVFPGESPDVVLFEKWREELLAVMLVSMAAGQASVLRSDIATTSTRGPESRLETADFPAVHAKR